MAPLSPLLSADLIESETDYHIHADLPGVEGIDLEMKDGYLIMKAERKISDENKTDIAHSMERSYGNIYRQIKLPKLADQENAKAIFKDGVLTVSFPKLSTPTVEIKKINITKSEEK